MKIDDQVKVIRDLEVGTEDDDGAWVGCIGKITSLIERDSPMPGQYIVKFDQLPEDMHDVPCTCNTEVPCNDEGWFYDEELELHVADNPREDSVPTDERRPPNDS